MILPNNSVKKIDKALELIWFAKDKLKPDMTEDDLSLAIGQLKRADNILGNVQYELADAEDDD